MPNTEISHAERKNRSRLRRRGEEREGNTRRPVFPCPPCSPSPTPFSAAVTRNNLVGWTLDANTPGPRTAAEPSGTGRSSVADLMHSPIAHATFGRLPPGSAQDDGRSICGLGPWFEDPKRRASSSRSLLFSAACGKFARRHPDADPWRGSSDLMTIWSSCASAGYELRCKSMTRG